MNLPDFLVQHSDGEIVLTGHRIGLFHVVHYFQEGFSPEMLAGQYPTLPLALIYKVIGFYLDHRAEVDAYVKDCREELDQQRSAETGRLDLAVLRQRLEKAQQAEVS